MIPQRNIGFHYYYFRRQRKQKADQVSYKQCLPHAEDTLPQMNYYETVNDPDTKSVTMATSTAGTHIYHQPWEQRPGISLPNRAKSGDLAYATSEEIKVLIENMERDRKFLNEGVEEHFPVPDRVYYRHISDYTYQPDESDDDDDEDDVDGKNDSETESKSVNSENSGTEQVGSEDSKVEADRAIDSDSESQKVESETVSASFDGYESPRVSSFHPSDTSSNRRSSNRYSDYRSEFQRLVSQSSSVIAEDTHSDTDVPLEYAPPVSQAINQLEVNSNVIDQSDDTKDNEISVGSYGEPRESTDSGQGADSESDISGHFYSTVYDGISETQTKL